jgi:hypothetical protein
MQQQVRRLNNLSNERGNLSVDFLAGFTIFLLAFIWVSSMISGIMVGLQSSHIDYDAVAYRTGVILVEDPGWPAAPPWEFYGDDQKFEISRFGLAMAKDTPGVLSQDKINRFFCTSFIYPDDYQTRTIFGDFPYRFNISVTDVEMHKNQSLGDVLPPGYGYIRRLAKIKGDSNATIGSTLYTKYQYNNTENVTMHQFSILIDNTELNTDMRNQMYQIDPTREQIIINLTQLRSTIKEFPTAIPPITQAGSTIKLQNITVYKLDGGILSKVRDFTTPYVDGGSTVAAMPALVQDNVSLIINPRTFDIMQAGYSQVYFNVTFTVSPASTFLNNTNARSQPFRYSYSPENVTQPHLRDAIVEVAVW